MPKRKCTFNEELKKKFPFMKLGNTDWIVNCTLCNSTISIANKGVQDINSHLETQKHKKGFTSQDCSKKIDTFFSITTVDNELRAVEGCIAYHTIVHNMSFLSLDCTIGLNKELFSDSQRVKNISCNRTKATGIVKKVLAPLSTEMVRKNIEQINFVSVSSDTSNFGATKLLPILIQYFDAQNNGIQTKILDVLSIKNETSDTITDTILMQLDKYGLKTKCVAFSGDNCNTNFGGMHRYGENNVFAKLTSALQKKIIGVGCPAHIINNAIHKGCDTLSFDVESIVLKVFNHFSVYTVRTETLKEFCEQSEIEYAKLLYHSKTRWLSLYPAIERILKLFAPLKNYFLNVESTPKVIKTFFESDVSEAYLFTIHSSMNIVQTNILKIERLDISVLEVKNILKEISENLNERLENNFIPLKVKEIIKNVTDEPKKNLLMEETKIFYKTIKDYIESWTLPLKNLDVFDWLCFQNVDTVNWTVVQKSVEFLKEFNIAFNDENLFNEFLVLKNYLKTVNSINTTDNKFWCDFFIKNDVCYEMKKLVEFYFCLPAHNANVERIFSLIKAQWTPERNKLDPETISDIIRVKYNFDMKCQEFYEYLKKCDSNILSQIGSTEKYL